MIFDKLSNIANYRGISKNLDTAIDYILNNDLQNLPLGKTVIDGDLVFVNCMEAETGLVENKQYEVHHKYLDIQIDLQGVERLLTGDSASMEMGEYNADTDYAPCQCPSLADCVIGPGNFIICMTGEPHMPGIAPECPASIKKCVFKVHK